MKYLKYLYLLCAGLNFSVMVAYLSIDKFGLATAWAVATVLWIGAAVFAWLTEKELGDA